MIKKVDHFVLTTADMDACLCFYEAIGFTARRGADRCELYAGDFKINVHYLGREISPHAGRVQAGSADFCLEVEEDVSRLAARLRAAGIVPEIEDVVRTGVRGTMRSVYLRDPDGNLVELSCYS